MKRLIIAAAASLAAATGGLALDKPKAGSQDARVRFVDYAPFNVVRVIGSIRSSVQVEVATDEDITHVALGNTVAWEVAVSGNIVFLKAREVQPPTNAQIVTTRKDGSRRSYQLELVVDDQVATPQPALVNATSAAGGAAPTYFYVKYRYPADEAAARASEQAEKAASGDRGRADRILAGDEQRGPRNWHYTARGTVAIEPVSVFDNGKLTTFVFAGVQDIPAIYLVAGDGTETLVPKSVAGDEVRVHAIARQFMLRRGHDVLAVFNEDFDPIGVEPGTRTTSPAVERVATPRIERAAPDGVPLASSTLMPAPRPATASPLPPPPSSLSGSQAAASSAVISTGSVGN